MDQRLLLKAGIPLLVVGLVLALFFMMGRALFTVKPVAPEPLVTISPQAAPASAPVTLDPGLAPIAPADSGANQVADKLRLARAELDKAIRGMAGATKKNHGGFVEKAQAELKQTAQDLTDAMAFADAHPEIIALPGAAPAETLAAAEHLMGLTFPKPNNQGHLVDGLNGLQRALTALQESRGGDIGGNREKLIADMDRAATSIYDGFHFLQNKGNTPTNSPQPTPPSILP